MVKGVCDFIFSASIPLHNDQIIPFDTLKKKVGNGRNTLFWKDVWLGDTPLKLRFLYLLC